jgi:hypothetical protein
MGSAVAVEDGEEVHGRAVDPGEEARLEGDGVLHLAHLPGRELHGRLLGMSNKSAVFAT